MHCGSIILQSNSRNRISISHSQAVRLSNPSPALDFGLGEASDPLPLSHGLEMNLIEFSAA